MTAISKYQVLEVKKKLHTEPGSNAFLVRKLVIDVAWRIRKCTRRTRTASANVPHSRIELSTSCESWA